MKINRVKMFVFPERWKKTHTGIQHRLTLKLFCAYFSISSLSGGNERNRSSGGEVFPLIHLYKGQQTSCPVHRTTEALLRREHPGSLNGFHHDFIWELVSQILPWSLSSAVWAFKKLHFYKKMKDGPCLLTCQITARALFLVTLVINYCHPMAVYPD